MKYFILVILMYCHTGYAQTVTIAHVSVPVEYYSLPEEPLPSTYKTYSTDIDIRSSELFGTGLTEYSLASEYLSLSGYQKVSTKGDVMIEAVIDDFRVQSERRGTQQVKRKDKDGKQITHTHHYIEVRYAQPVSFRVYDYSGKKLKDEIVYGAFDSQTWRSSTYSSLSELDRAWRSQRSSKLSDLQRDRIKQGMKIISDRINTLYGYQLISEKERIEKIGRKKHLQYKAFHTTSEIVMKAFKLMRANADLTEVAKAVQPAIDFYKKAESTCKAGDKEEEKIRHIALYNLSFIYFWLEDFTQARKYAEAIYLFDPKDKDARRMLEEIDRVETLMKKSKRTTRHQVIAGGKA